MRGIGCREDFGEAKGLTRHGVPRSMLRKDMNKFSEHKNSDTRAFLRMLGWVLLIIGGIFAAVGFVDFFSAFGGDNP